MVQIFIVFIISVMTVVGVILLNSVFNFFKSDFVEQVEGGFSEAVLTELENNMAREDFAAADKALLSAYSGVFGFDSNRSFYILDTDGTILATNAATAEGRLEKTRNMLAAMNGEPGKKQTLGASELDYALYVSGYGRACIVYVTDNLSKMRNLSWILFSIIIQALLLGLLIAIVLSFFLAQAITAPISRLADGTLKISSGDYAYRLETMSKDEIGALTKNFNTMAQVIENNLDAVNREKEKLSKIIGCLKDGVAAFDKDGKLMLINDSARHLLGLSKKTDITFEAFAARLDAPITAQFLKTSRTINITEHRIESSLSNETVVDIGFRVFDYGKRETGYLAVVQDVTEKALLEKSRREFIANVSHELRTPLTSIKGATETVLLDEEMPLGVRQRFLNIVMGESDRMTRIVKDLLVLSRFDNRRMTWQVSTFPVDGMISQICTALKTSADQKQHTLTYAGEGADLGEMSADKERIEQVLTNIIGNAIKYTPDGGRIEVRAENIVRPRDDKSEPERFCRVVVSDNGVGIPKEDLPHLFERFYRVDKARSSDMGGTGLGLSIAKEIVEAHGGSIAVSSEENQGTTVICELPLVSGVGA